MPRKQDPERYFLGYFTGEGLADGEQLRFGLSTGNSALDWVGLGGGKPSLVSQLGDQGLRDPFIIRSHDGDTFYMIATDLNWFNRNRDYQINDSQYIEVFESHDLVNWSPQRHVKVAPDNAGNAFAPEAYWDDSIGAYVVFWAQAMWNDPVNRTGPGNQQMWYTTTRDFRTFAPPAVWQNPAPQSRIDTTVIKVGDWYYRFTKNEAGNAASDVFSEKNRNLRDTNIANWTPVAPSIGRPARGWPTRATRARWSSRPTRATPPAREQFYFWADRYTNGGGYQLSCSPDIEAPKWTAKTPRFTNTGTVRHGTVTPLALREWNRIQGIANPDVATTTDLVLPGPTIKEGDTAQRHRPRGGRLRDRRPRALLGAGLGADRLPRPRRGLGHAPGHAARRRRDGQGRVPRPRLPDRRRRRPSRSPCCRPARRSTARSAAPSRRRCRSRSARPVSFGAFTPGVAKDYTASTTATVTSTAGDAALSASTATLTNGAFSLAQPVAITPAKTAWSGPASNDVVRDRVQAVDRRDRAAAHRRLQRERHVHAVDHDAVSRPRPAHRARGNRPRAR